MMTDGKPLVNHPVAARRKSGRRGSDGFNLGVTVLNPIGR